MGRCGATTTASRRLERARLGCRFPTARYERHRSRSAVKAHDSSCGRCSSGLDFCSSFRDRLGSNFCGSNLVWGWADAMANQSFILAPNQPRRPPVKCGTLTRPPCLRRPMTRTGHQTPVAASVLLGRRGRPAQAVGRPRGPALPVRRRSSSRRGSSGGPRPLTTQRREGSRGALATGCWSPCVATGPRS